MCTFHNACCKISKGIFARIYLSATLRAQDHMTNQDNGNCHPSSANISPPYSISAALVIPKPPSSGAAAQQLRSPVLSMHMDAAHALAAVIHKR